MLNVVAMDRWVSRDTVALLKKLLELAEHGEIDGLALCYRLSDGREWAEMSGHFRRVPKDGLAAAMKLSFHLTQNDGGFSDLP